MNKQELIDFEEGIAQEFNNGNIPYPVHLEQGNEQRLIDIFKDLEIGPNDYVYGSWRLHLKALLKGVPPESLKQEIMQGHSMALKFPAHRVYGSAIVGGIVPIALGTAMGINARDGNERVFCFVGDMTSQCGIFHECYKYARNFELPIYFIIEDNGLSVCTDTRKVWGNKNTYQSTVLPPETPPPTMIQRYEYKSKWPHCGAGKRVQF